MVGLSDIFPIRSIYFGSGFAVLVWTLPYAFGLMITHFRLAHWLKGIGWLLFILFIPSFVLARVFAWGLENDLYTPRTVLMSITCVVAAGQAVFWGLLWIENRRRGESGPWRTIAAAAFAGGLVLTLMSCGSFYLEKRYRYLESVRLRQQSGSDLVHMADAGYLPYPDAHYRFGEVAIRESYEDEILAGYFPDLPGGYSEALSIDFQTPDDPVTVLDFYADHMHTTGMEVLKGTSRASGEPILIGARAESCAILIERLVVSGESIENDWSITVFWDIPPDFIENLKLNFKLE